MKVLFWRKSPKPPPSATSTEAQEAIERARDSKHEAQIDLREMQVRAERIKKQRDDNHFAPLIFEAMKRNDT